jgi:hypothetical protein
MSHKAVKEAVFVLLPQYRVRLTIQRSPAAVALAIIKTSALIIGDVPDCFASRTMNSSALAWQLLANRAGGPRPSVPAPTMAGTTKLIHHGNRHPRYDEVESWATSHSWPEGFDFRCAGAALSYRNRNARLLNELHHRTDDLGHPVNELHALGEVFHAMNLALDLKTELSTIVSKAMQYSSTEAGTTDHVLMSRNWDCAQE